MIAHWIKSNEMSRQPNRWVWLAVGSRQITEGGRDFLVWDGAVTCSDSRETNDAVWREAKWDSHTDSRMLWDTVTRHARANARLVCMAWGMGETVRLAGALHHLPSLGWRLDRWQVGDRFCLLKWANGNRTLTLTDAVGCLPMGKRKLATMVDALEPQPADLELGREWIPARPYLEVKRLRAAMLDLLAWQHDQDLGNWQPTSGSQAWANWRHKHYTHPVLVHDNDEARATERESAYTGRCEAWQWGPLAEDRWTEWDLPLAYPSVCLDERLPVRLKGYVRHPPPSAVNLHPGRLRWLVNARVRTDRPTLPYRHQGGILWPVGDLEGWWWDTELAAAEMEGAKVEPLSAYHYLAEPALTGWAESVIEYVQAGGDDATPLRQAVVKGWGRSLIGRFGTRYWSWEDWGATQVGQIRMDHLADRDTGHPGRWLHIGGRSMVALGMVDGVETAPAVMAAIMAACRVRLWRIIQTAGEQNVAYCDTDSVLVNRAGDAELARAVDAGRHYGLRRKGEWRDLEVRGPRQVFSRDERRVSGVPNGATRGPSGILQGAVRESLESAVAAGRPDRVATTPRTWQVTGTDRRRVHLPDGTTTAVRL